MTWDCIRNRVETVTLGEYEYAYFNELTSSLQAIQKVIGPGDTLVAERVSGVLNAINTQLRYQKNIAQKQDVRAILFEDTDPDSPTYGAMCLGTQGFQIADTRTQDGSDWDWTTAFTAKGGYANTLITGLLSDKTGKSYWNLDTGNMRMSGVFQQIASNGYKSVDILDNHINFYSWLQNGDYTGSVGATKRSKDGRLGVELWCAPDDMVMIGYDDGTGGDDPIQPVFSFDAQKPTSTPYIINTTNGTLFPNNRSGGITIENGLIKKYSMYSVLNSTLSVITGIAGNSSGITKVTYADIKIRDGLIDSWSSRTVEL